MNRKRLSYLALFVLFLAIPVLVYLVEQTTHLISRATGIPADIIVDTSRILEPIPQSWKAFSQGGEESVNMIEPVVGSTRLLDPDYIRIDHLYDHFEVVSRDSDGQLQFDFSRLDGLVRSILATSATPFLSLSYMPSVIARDGNIVNAPNNWNEWALVVQRTIEHYSGRNGLNINNVYYEVWNEPDLFGNWKMYGDKNYGTLYSYAVTGAQQASNVNPFKIGGPATTALYESWMRPLFKYAAENNVRVDFLSWHRYSTDPKQFSADLRNLTTWSFDYPAFTTIPKLITEWGFDPEINSGYDGSFAAAHTVATIREALFGFNYLFAFEVVDGPDPAGQEYWGRWGLISHPTKGAHLKPRYSAFSYLNQMQGNRLLVKGEGTWVTGFGVKDGNTIKLLLANYDRNGSHTETVPITFGSLANGTYTYKQRVFPGNSTTLTETITDGTLKKSLFMPRSSIALLELTPQ